MRTILLIVAVIAFAVPASANLLTNGDFEMGNNTGWTQYGSGGFGLLGVASYPNDIGGYPLSAADDENSDGTPYYTRVTYWSDMGHSGRGSNGQYQVVTVPPELVGQELTLDARIHWHNHQLQYTWHEWGIIDGTWTNPDNLSGATVSLYKATEVDPNPGDWINISLKLTPM